MKHYIKLQQAGVKLVSDTSISLPVAKDLGYYAAILYTYLQDNQIERKNYGDAFNVRKGLRWIPKLAVSQILNEMPVFPDELTITRAAETLKNKNLILTETTGAFLEHGHETGRKRDIATWWHVLGITVPPRYLDVAKRRCFSAILASLLGIPKVLILAEWQLLPIALTDEYGDYKHLSAVQLEKTLPMDERTIRRHLKGLLKVRALIVHPTKPKLYRSPHSPRHNAEEGV